jgi:hypothetical protein
MTLHVRVCVYAAAMCGCLHYVLAPCHVASCMCTNVSEEVLSPSDSEKSCPQMANVCILLGATPVLACTRYSDSPRAGRSGDRIPVGGGGGGGGFTHRSRLARWPPPPPIKRVPDLSRG